MLTKTLHPIHQKVLQLMVDRQIVKTQEVDELMARYHTIAKIVEALVKDKRLSEEQIAKLFSVAYDIPFVHLVGRSIPTEILATIPEAVARKYSMVPFERKGKVVTIAIGQPYRLSISASGPLHEHQQKLGVDFRLAITPKADIEWALAGYNRVTVAYDKPLTKDQDKSASVSPVPETLPFIDLKNRLIARSILERFPEDIAKKYSMIVFDAPSPKELHVALVYPNDPQTIEILDYIGQKNNLVIKRFQTSTKSFEAAMAGYKTDDASKATVPSFGKTLQITAQPFIPRPAEPSSPDTKTEPAELAQPKQLFDVQYEHGVPIIIEKSGVHIQALAEQTEKEELQESNLDKVLKIPVKKIEDLVNVVVTGYVPKVVAAFVGFAVNQKASDIHIEPMEDHVRLRYRIDGVLSEIARLPLSMHPAIISRIKILSNMKIDEQRVPQDGRFDAQSQGHMVDLRVSSLPTVHGEKIVTRILDKSAGILTLEQLGLGGTGFEKVLEAIKKPWGVIMATGPTGSGKSTTLYAILNRISSIKVNVITLEDPVEYEIAGINQTQVKPKIGFSFAEGLRSVLRQDPNVIMVGEVRDKETAELVTHAALTGHLVLTTLHTNDAPGALPRLINMGVEPFLITSAINAIIAQRLVRKLCQECKKSTSLPEPVMNKIKKEIDGLQDHDGVSSDILKFYDPVGCDKCTEGFKGRIGIYEVMAISDAVELAALQRKPASEIGAIAIKEGMITMRQDGILKAAKGLTTVDEVMKATSA